jgi:hypothetical protein
MRKTLIFKGLDLSFFVRMKNPPFGGVQCDFAHFVRITPLRED